MTSTIPPWQYTLRYLQPEMPRIQKSMMRIMRRNEYDEEYEEERAKKYRDIRVEEGNFSIGSWADDRYHESYADEYGVYRDDQGHARDVDGHVNRVSKDDIRSLLERASMDEHNYLCLPEHARSFTQTKLVPEIYTKDEINEMLYGVCGSQEKNEDDFQMKLDSVYYPLNDSITTAPASIDRKLSTSIDDEPSHSNPMKSRQDSYTRAEIDQIVEDIYRTLGATKERLDKRCDDIYFPWDITISSLTSQTKAMKREIIEI
ncbi:hypothetical protein F2Q68_00004907 [Brassica cretica]|uniref:Uncharacterized protein n=2 Tax=Brassica cretica TaxID=69181 RepID=A0A8S9J3P0_BRACR|nr:hypothetical protein F2Q68_00004907 [Brassica cretica]KAF3543085.1 hypothetical protein DY000_02007394 [Brassica cretica]